MEHKTFFEALLQKHHIAVERYIHFRIPDSHDADDVVQETYCAAFSGFSRLNNPERFKTWILAIARNQCNLYFRKKYSRETLPLEAAEEMADAAAEEDEIGAQDILKGLPDRLSAPLKLSVQGYRQNEIARRLGIPPGTVKSRLYYARKQFRENCSPQQLDWFEKGRKTMPKIDYTRPFPPEMPPLIIQKSPRPFRAVKCADEAFIIPKIGNRNAEGTYRGGKLALVSVCYVPKAARIHDAEGVQICRDTYNIREGRLYKNEKIWFAQLTDDYIRDLGTISGMNDEDTDSPIEMVTFLDEDYDVIVNGGDRIHGRPLLIEEHPPRVERDEIFVDEYHLRYTMGCFDLTIGQRTFAVIKTINVQNKSLATENYVDEHGRLVLMRWYESSDYIAQTGYYTEAFRQAIAKNLRLVINSVEYCLVEDRISEYAL